MKPTKTRAVKRSKCMKKFLKAILTVLCLALSTVLLFGCGYEGDFGGGFADDYMGEIGSAGTMTPSGSENGGGSTGEYQAGRMSAGAHNDNLYYGLWQSLFLKGQTDSENGKFLNYTGTNDWGLNTLNRIKVTVKNGENVATNAKVVFNDNSGNKLYTAKTDANGVAYIFGNTDGGSVTARTANFENTVSVDSETEEIQINLDGNIEKGKTIEIMFVVDVTGSMSDELNYLKSELKDVVNRIATSFSDAKINLALLFYRDDGDSEKFSYSDFLDVTDKKNLDIQQKAINVQTANGGGDYPEAVDEALQLAASKQWSDNSTKIIFHVLDAPAHDKATYKQRYKQAVVDLAEKGVRICPVLASGADLTTEYITRQAAVMTGGTFTFITDHSGIGNSHLDPEIPNVVIENLNDLMVRLVKGYYTGTFESPVSYNGKTYHLIDASQVKEGFIVSGAKRAYAVGDSVTIITKLTDAPTSLFVDGVLACEGTVFTEEIYSSQDGPNTYLKFTFTMPDKDVIITFLTELQ